MFVKFILGLLKFIIILFPVDRKKENTEELKKKVTRDAEHGRRERIKVEITPNRLAIPYLFGN